jgi:outer membrane cobalamin receptor
VCSLQQAVSHEQFGAQQLWAAGRAYSFIGEAATAAAVKYRNSYLPPCVVVLFSRTVH